MGLNRDIDCLGQKILELDEKIAEIQRDEDQDEQTRKILVQSYRNMRVLFQDARARLVNQLGRK